MTDEEPKNDSIKYVISACLVGCQCRYDGKHQRREEMHDLYERGMAIAICPEELAGLGTPRPPCERNGEKIISSQGECKTDLFIEGAIKASTLVSCFSIQRAYLKSKSPMCGHGQIYDGSFTGRLTQGSGVFAQLLVDQGIEITVVD